MKPPASACARAGPVGAATRASATITPSLVHLATTILPRVTYIGSGARAPVTQGVGSKSRFRTRIAFLTQRGAPLTSFGLRPHVRFDFFLANAPSAVGGAIESLRGSSPGRGREGARRPIRLRVGTGDGGCGRGRRGWRQPSARPPARAQ